MMGFGMPQGWDWFWIGLCVVQALLPPRWDPAIRLKEWAYARLRCRTCKGTGNVGPRVCRDCGGMRP